MVIRNGTIVDGSGAPGYLGDVGVAGGRIVAIGKVDADGCEVIDAQGHVVTPGFIDGHTHMDAQVHWDPLGTCSCWHGVTTVVMGNCGFTLAPSRAEARSLVVRTLERAEDIAADVMAAGIKWRWETFPEFLDALDELPMGINYVAQIGHSALRTWAMGERAFDGSATVDDIALMRTQLAAALRAGAIGFSTSVSESHEMADGRPVASRNASWEELSALVDEIRTAGHGVFQISLGRVRDGTQETYRRVLELAERTGVPTTFAMNGDPSAVREMGREIADIVARGGKIFPQVRSRQAGSVMSLETNLPFDRMREWTKMRALPLPEQLTYLRDPERRRMLVDAANSSEYEKRAGPEPPRPNYAAMTILDSPVPPYSTVADVASMRGIDPVEVMIDLILESEGRQFFFQPFTVADEAFLSELMGDPINVVSVSDSGAHVTQILESSVPTYLLAHWVRSRHEFGFEEAVQMLTGRMAEAWGLCDRGVVREGMVADLNVVDPLEIGPLMPTVAHDLPAAGPRLVQKSKGILATLVAGEVVFRDGEHTGALPGRLLRVGGSK
ncbi:MAG TPA: amidohydrolase family protein [Acidimicrobiales bacterium]|nr:amidohydrolase family protein [Acidimicrobiales bacterium]